MPEQNPRLNEYTKVADALGAAAGVGMGLNLLSTMQHHDTRQNAEQHQIKREGTSVDPVDPPTGEHLESLFKYVKQLLENALDVKSGLGGYLDFREETPDKKPRLGKCKKVIVWTDGSPIAPSQYLPVIEIDHR